MKRSIKKAVSCVLVCMLAVGLATPFNLPFGIEYNALAITPTNAIPTSVINALRLQKSSAQIGSLGAASSVFVNFTDEWTQNNAVSVTSSTNNKSNYPWGEYLISAKDIGSGNNFNAVYEWHLDSTEDKWLKLLAKGNSLWLGTYAEFYTDSEGGTIAGRPHFKLEYGSSSSYGSAIEIAETSKTYPDYSKKGSDWYRYSPLTSSTRNAFKATFFSERSWLGHNYAKIRYPQVYLKDDTSPTISSVSIDSSNNSTVNYAKDDEILVKIVFNEPIRAKNGRYSENFDIKLGGTAITSWEDVSFNDETFTLTVKHKVLENETISANQGSLSVSIKNEKYINITDIAGNTYPNTASSPKTATNNNLIVDGSIPKINSIKATGAFIKYYDENAKKEKYRFRSDVGTALKPGDVLIYDVVLSQRVKNTNTRPSIMYIRVGSSNVEALPGIVYSGSSVVANNRVDKSNAIQSNAWSDNLNDVSLDNFNWGYSISNFVEFNKVSFIARIPENAANASAISIRASKSGSNPFVLTDNSPFVQDIKGNLSLAESRRKAIGTTTGITTGSTLLPTLSVDSTAPKISITDALGSDLQLYVKGTDQLQTVNLGEKSGGYAIAFKTDEELLGDVSYKIYYKKMGAADATATTIKSGSIKSYRTPKPVVSECITFSIPAGVDNVLHEIYIDIQCYDKIYNPYNPSNNLSKNRKWFLADKVAPKALIDANSGIRLSDGNTQKYFEYIITGSDDASPEGMTLYYRFSSDSNPEYKSLVNDGNSDTEQTFVVASDKIDSEQDETGVFSYYLVDASGNSYGNASLPYTSNYVLGDTEIAPLTIKDIESLSEYLPPRNVVFEGFESYDPEQDAEEFQEHLTYRFIADGEEDTEIDSRIDYNGNDSTITIPASELQESGTIVYSRVREITGESSRTIHIGGAVSYICDNEDPGVNITPSIEEQLNDNLLSLDISAPATEGHRDNIETANLKIIPKSAQPVDFDLSDNILGGRLVFGQDADKILTDNGFTSGEYRFEVTVTDSNGHISTESYPDENSFATVIFDKPIIRSVSIKADSGVEPSLDGKEFLTTTTDPYGEGISITDEVIKAQLENDLVIKKADLYYLNVLIDTAYAGDGYGDGTVEYAISDDEGSWSEFAPVESYEPQTANGETVTNNVYLKLPAQQDDGVYTYRIKCRVKGNSNETEIFNAIVGHDRTPPLANPVAMAVGSDGNWNSELDYTNQYEKVDIYTIDEGFISIRPTVKITSVTTMEDGMPVQIQEQDFGSVVKDLPSSGILESYDEQKGAYEICLMEACTVKFSVTDVFGNSFEYRYTTQYIDKRDMKSEIAFARDGTLFAITGDAVNTEFYLRDASASGDVSESEKQLFEENIGNLYSFALISEVPGEREGDYYRVYKIAQTGIAPSPLKITMMSTDRYGNTTAIDQDGNSHTIKDCLTLQSTNNNVNEKNFENTVSNQGDVIRTFQKLEFDVPVTIIRKNEVDVLNNLDDEIKDLANESSRSFGKVVYAVLSTEDDSSFYVSDRLGSYKEITLDVSGTNFTSYPNYTEEYYLNSDGLDISTGENTDFGLYVPIKVIVKSNTVGVGSNVVAKCSVSLTDNDKLFEINSGLSDLHTDPSMSGRYSQMVLDNSQRIDMTESANYAQEITIRDGLDGRVYKDIVLLNRFDILKPELVKAVNVYKNNAYSPQQVIYIFHDENGISGMEGSFRSEGSSMTMPVNVYSSNGVYTAIYEINGEPFLDALDTAGNRYTAQLEPIESVAVSNTLTEGVDFTIKAKTESGDPCLPDTYYRKIIAWAEPLGEKGFTGGEAVEIDQPGKHVFKLINEVGDAVFVIYNPPIDATPPKVVVSQNYQLDSLTFDISISDDQSGVASVTLEEEPLTPTSPGRYSVTQTDNKSRTLKAVDNCQNETIRILSPDRIIYDNLIITDTQDIYARTNTNVVVTLSAQPGRKPVYSIGTQPSDEYLSIDKVMISNNKIVFFENGRLQVTCTGETGEIVLHELEVTNIDKTPPNIQGIVTLDSIEEDSLSYDAGRSVSVSFKATDPQDDIADEIFLVNERLVKDTGGLEYEEEMRNYFENLASKLSENISIGSIIPLQDIKDEKTKVIIAKNGEYSFTLKDKVGNVTKATVNITDVDTAAPNLENIKWTYKYLTGPTYEIITDASGTITEVKTGSNDNYLTGTPQTNQNVTVTVKSDEPVKELGRNTKLKDYKTDTTKVFTGNGRYTFNLLDMANNISQATVNLDLIEKRIPQFEFENSAQNVCFFEAEPESYDKNKYTGFKVYKYDGNQKVYLEQSEYDISIDWGGFNPDNLMANTFDRTKPYIINYTVWDKVGNKREAQKIFTLVSLKDTVVTVNGMLPNEFSEIVTESGDVTITIKNYSHKAYTKLESGLYSATQMKRRGTNLSPDTGTKGTYSLKGLKQGWHTINVVTQHQDYFNINIYVTK